MKIIKKELITEEKDIIEDIICNKCGKTCNKNFEDSKLNPDPYGLIEVTVSGGFLSKPLHDGNSYTFSLCEQCLQELFDNFKIPVEITHWL